MRKSVLLFLVPLLSVLAWASTTSSIESRALAEEPQSWRFAFTRFSYYIGSPALLGRTSIALDSKDLPHISYQYGDYHSLRHIYHNGMYWVRELVDNVDSRESAIAVDSKDYSHITYVEYQTTPSPRVKYAHFNGGSWKTEVVANYTENIGIFPGSTIALDSQDNPHITYLNGSGLQYAFFDGLSWTKETVDSDCPYAGSENARPFIALDSENHPHIAYSGLTETTRSLKYAGFDGSSWNIQTIDRGGAGPSLVLDPSGDPHISYNNGTALKYAYFDGALWNIEVVEMVSSGVYVTSLAIDSESRPHIVWGAKYAYYGDDSWEITTINEDEGYEYLNDPNSYRRSHGHWGSCLSIGSDDKLRVSYVSQPKLYWEEVRMAVGTKQYLTNFEFNYSSGSSPHVQPSLIEANSPAIQGVGTCKVRFSMFSNQWLDCGDWTLQKVMWQGSNVKPLADVTYTPVLGGTWTINCQVFLVSFKNSFKDNDGDDLHTLPSSFELVFPNGTTSAPLDPNLSYFIQNGNTTWNSILWQGNDVYPSNVSFDPTNGNPTVNCTICSLTLDPIFYDNTGTTLIHPTSWAIKFPNDTTRTVSSSVTYNQTPTGNYSISSITWKGAEVVPDATPTTSLTSDTLWSPSINCLLPTSISLSLSSSTSYVGFKVNINGSLTCNEVGLSETPLFLSYSVTGGETWNDMTLINTASDGSYSAVWMPAATGSYLVRATWSGDSIYPGSITTVNLAVIPFEEKSVFSVASNSTVSELAFNSTSRELSFTVTGPSDTTGYVNVFLAKTLVGDIADVEVYFDGDQIDYVATSLDDSWHLHFTYSHSIHSIAMSLGPARLIPPQLITPLSIGMLAAVLVVATILFIFRIRKGTPTTILDGAFSRAK
ncbi:MAG: hypothetical protein PVF15_09230 [Candidatus Bathyarchaeota archaeon]